MKVAKSNAIEAWHFLPADRRTRYSNELVTKGSVLHVPGEIAICERGLHASRRAIDALKYARGAVVCRVRVWGDVYEEKDKIVGSYRECIRIGDATRTLHEFACCVAEAALLIAEVNDERCWNAIEAKRAWLRGDIGLAELRVSAAAVHAAADSAAAAAHAHAAVHAAADSAADSAVYAAAVAVYAAAAAAHAAAHAHAAAEMNKTLESMLRSVCK